MTDSPQMTTTDLHVEVRQRLGIPERRAHTVDKRLDFGMGPAQNLPDRVDGESIERLVDEQAIVQTDLLERAVVRPAPDWHLPLLVDDVDEAGFLGVPLHLTVARNAERPAELVARFPE